MSVIADLFLVLQGKGFRLDEGLKPHGNLAMDSHRDVEKAIFVTEPTFGV